MTMTSRFKSEIVPRGSSITTSQTSTTNCNATSKHSLVQLVDVNASTFKLSEVIHHGFPFKPTCMSYDSASGLLAIGSETGYIRVFGREMVDRCFRDDVATKILFISLRSYRHERLNLITVCDSDCIALWDVCSTRPKKVIDRYFAKEKFSAAKVSVSGKLLFYGTEAGNIYILSTRTLELSHQIIHWNHAVGPSFRSHPGPITFISPNPLNAQKIFIGYSPSISDNTYTTESVSYDEDCDVSTNSGLLVKWNLKSSSVEHIITMNTGLVCMSWCSDGRNFFCGHLDGSYSVWNAKSLDKPTRIEHSHGLIVQSKTNETHPIHVIRCIRSKISDARACFVGGIHIESNLCRSRYLTIVRKQSTNVFQMNSYIIDICVVYEMADDKHYILAILLEDDLAFLEFNDEECFLHESSHISQLGKLGPITFFDYIASPDAQFYSTLLKLHKYYAESEDVSNQRTLLGSTDSGLNFRRTPQQSRSDTSQPVETKFPLTGGVPAETVLPYNEIVITGHLDGRICFWDSSAMNLTPLHVLTFQRFLYVSNPTTSECEDSQSIDYSFTNESKLFSFYNGSNEGSSVLMSIKSVSVYSKVDLQQLLVIGDGGHVTLMQFDINPSDPNEDITDITVLDIPQTSIYNAMNKDFDTSFDDGQTLNLSTKSNTSPRRDPIIDVRVACRRLVGYHPSLICLFTSDNRKGQKHLSTASSAILVEDRNWLVILANQTVTLVDAIMKRIIGLVSVEEMKNTIEPFIFTGQQSSPCGTKSPLLPNESTSSFQETAGSTYLSLTDFKETPNQDESIVETDASQSEASDQSVTDQLHACRVDDDDSAERIDKALDRVKSSDLYDEQEEVLPVKHPHVLPKHESELKSDLSKSSHLRKYTALPHVLPLKKKFSSQHRKLTLGTNALRRMSVRPMKFLQRQTDNITPNVEFTAEEDEFDFSKKCSGLFIVGSSSFMRSQSNDTESIGRDLSCYPPMVWIATSTNKVFAMHIDFEDVERRSVRTTRYWDPFTCDSTPLLLEFFTVISPNKMIMQNQPNKLKHTSQNDYILLVTVNTIKTYCLPHRCCTNEQNLGEDIQSAHVFSLDDMIYLSTVNLETPILQIFTLPKLDLIHQCCLKLTPEEFSKPISRRLKCSNQGMICCLLNPFELCKWSVCSEISMSLETMSAQLICPHQGKKSVRRSSQIRSEPKERHALTKGATISSTSYESTSSGFSIFKLFSSVDSNETFEEHLLFKSRDSASGSSNPCESRNEPRGVFRYTSTMNTDAPNSIDSSIDQTKFVQSGTQSSVLAMLKIRQQLHKMTETAMEFQKTAKQLANKQKEKSEKWWQLWR